MTEISFLTSIILWTCFTKNTPKILFQMQQVKWKPKWFFYTSIYKIFNYSTKIVVEFVL